jgi:HAD superfamily hydrolase (TIGR01509 family)
VRAPIRVGLFDLGGTLFYDKPSAWPRVYGRAEAALWRGLRRSGVKLKPDELYGRSDTLLNYYYKLRGQDLEEPGTFRVLHDLLVQRGLSVPDAGVAKALRAMYAVTQTNWRLEADARSTVRALRNRGMRLGAVSNGSDHENALDLLDKARLRGEFEVIVTSAAHGRRKPDASIFQAALEAMGGEPETTVMIGDSYEADILGAHALGMATIWVIRRLGPTPAHGPVAPDATVGSLAAILPILR